MRALSFRQPYAHALLGPKPFDNRTNRPPLELIGQRIAIHAGVAFDEDDKWGLHSDLLAAGMIIHDLPLGGFVGTSLLKGYVLFDGCQPVALFDDKEKQRCGLTEREIYAVVGSCWRVESARVVLVFAQPKFLPKLLPWPGALGFWKVPAEHLAALEACR